MPLVRAVKIRLHHLCRAAGCAAEVRRCIVVAAMLLCRGRDCLVSGDPKPASQTTGADICNKGN